ncbi:MlaD family protein [Aureibacter tunicatorum]|uniref:Phospholipid/cholesterol/gamma-HCH transport system substrate-binding protein n=1 Tax=Aureibacter tunicatorum TaxID=866807 RepID=A0AAE3XLR0_9BACT|nr:MlaD family protein [Aureibacter tunicatorum]MDR6238328.1 phospholipid/cholesterol/gamma-HCH transport system substrate-binding protein [Aureibacter tunicatorum]BDD03360.1 organic solvent ABC transporter substrate-binding protein [Aureibacter tunicatorum]
MSKEFKVGIFGIAALVVFYFGFNFLKGSGVLSSMNHYYAVYDNVQGLTASNPVIYKGVEVGSVEKITLMKDRKILVELSVKKGLALDVNTVADLTSMGIMGNKGVVLKEMELYSGHVLHNGDTLQSAMEEDITEVLKKAAMPLAAKVDSLLLDFNGTGTSIKQTLASFKKTSDDLDMVMLNNQRELSSAISNFNQLAMKLNHTMDSLQPVVSNFGEVSEDLKNELPQTLENASKLMKNMNQTLAKINEGQGTIGKFVNNDSLYNNLNKSMVSLDSLLIDLREHPKRYVHFSVFGKKDK